MKAVQMATDMKEETRAGRSGIPSDQNRLYHNINNSLIETSKSRPRPEAKDKDAANQRKIGKKAER